jgi:predicted metalloprotease with PDZ domain
MLNRVVFAFFFVLVTNLTVSAQALRDSVSGPRATIIDRDGEPNKRPAESIGQNDPGYLGLITDDRRDAGRGIRVVKVVEDSPAAAAGFRADDLILAVDGAGVRSLDQLGRALEPRSAGDKLRFEVSRAGEPLTMEVTLGRRPPRDQRQFEFGRIPERMPGAFGDAPIDVGPVEGAGLPRSQLLGVRTAPVTEEVRQRLAVREPTGAVVVSRVVGSPAERAGIPLDAVIFAVNDQPVASPLDLARLIGAAGPGKEVAISFFAAGEERTVTVRLAEIPGIAGAIPGRAPPVDQAEPMPIPANADRDRINLLERRVRELELRVQELERLLRQRG